MIPDVPAEVPAPADVPASSDASASSDPNFGTFHALAPSDIPPLIPGPTGSSSPAAVASETTPPGPREPAPGTKAVASPPRRPTWGELPPPSSTRMVTSRGRTTLVRTTQNPRDSGDRPAKGDPVPRVQEETVRAACQYDAKHQKLIDFRLPDLQGRPVRFQELDADLVLIDFWGTWCGPCLNSIPHLVELQDRFGTQRLKVVGIAYEQGPAEGRSASLAATVRRLGINYPVLLGPSDGSCPLQAALHVQAYPTMILVDRQGRILWRDQGSTPTTLARLDRVVAAATRPDIARR
jgi:thiol-disulfide isomerase/thioredoxin